MTDPASPSGVLDVPSQTTSRGTDQNWWDSRAQTFESEQASDGPVDGWTDDEEIVVADL